MKCSYFILNSLNHTGHIKDEFWTVKHIKKPTKSKEQNDRNKAIWSLLQGFIFLYFADPLAK